MKKITLALLFVLVISSLASAKTHTVRKGDTLWDMAKKYYGDPTLYTIIAEVNGVSNPRTILDGTVLVIPNKSDMEKIAAEKDQKKRQELIKQAGGKTSSEEDNSKKDDGNGNKNTAKAPYVAPKPQDTTFESVLNKKINPKTIKTVDTDKE